MNRDSFRLCETNVLAILSLYRFVQKPKHFIKMIPVKYLFYIKLAAYSYSKNIPFFLSNFRIFEKHFQSNKNVAVCFYI